MTPQSPVRRYVAVWLPSRDAFHDRARAGVKGWENPSDSRGSQRKVLRISDADFQDKTAPWPAQRKARGVLDSGFRRSDGLGVFRLRPQSRCTANAPA